MSDIGSYEGRIKRLEKQIEILRTTIALTTISAQPAIDRMDKKFEALEEEDAIQE